MASEKSPKLSKAKAKIEKPLLTTIETQPMVATRVKWIPHLYNLHKYRFDPITEQGDFDGDPISLPYDQVYEMTRVPLRGYPAPPAEVIDFDHAFTRMLCHLDRAWAPGGAAELALATVEMPALTAKATQLLSKEIKRTDAPGIYGPQFKLI